jgi:sugar phosphate isomerase/epimerase
MPSTAQQPLLSMNLISTKLDVGQAIRAYHRAGYGGIGLWYDQLCEYGIDETLRVLEEVPIRVTHLVYAGPFNQTSEKDYLAAREEDREKLRVAARLGADSVLAMTGPLNGLGQNEAFRQLTRSLRDLAGTAAECGVAIGLEPLNYIEREDSFLFTLSDAMDIIEEVGHPSVGVFIDTYHIWHEPGLMKTMQRTRGRIVGCHINDFRHENRSYCDRVLMGDGCIPVRNILEEVRRQGWDKWYDIEIFSDELWALDPAEFLALARQKYDALWACEVSH